MTQIKYFLHTPKGKIYYLDLLRKKKNEKKKKSAFILMDWISNLEEAEKYG